MRVLSTAREVDTELRKLIAACISCRLAVAWATVGFPAFDLLLKNRQKVERMVVGTHFYQTHPEFMAALRDTAEVRFILNPDGVYHPKVYLFEMAGGSWKCIVGSMNFTAGGLAGNDEVAVLISDEDDGADSAFEKITSSIDSYWQAAATISDRELEAYRDAWKRKQQLRDKLRGRFVSPATGVDDQGKPPVTIPILQMTWSEYFDAVQAERLPAPHEHAMESRLRVLRVVNGLFASHGRLSEMDADGRRMIGGYLQTKDVDYKLFGSMEGAGRFKGAMNANNAHLSAAVDLIPLSGQVSRASFVAFAEEFNRAFADGHNRIGTSTRLLAMKRPDTFVCLDEQNKAGVCGAFGVRRSITLEEYWDSIVERIMDSVWWNAPPPSFAAEREVWNARAAFLDAHYYIPKDASPSGSPLN